MRFPLFADLDSDQKRLYSKSPSDGAILVVGPPGCGKTVVAAHRTVRLAASGKPVVLLMFGKVLSQFTSNFDGYTANTKITHAHSFWPNWYKNAFKTGIPKLERFRFDWREIKNLIRNCKDPEVLSALNWGHLIIDEGQDFEPEMYEALMALVQHQAIPEDDRPTLSVFADDNQTITDRNSSIPELMAAMNTSIQNNRLWRLDKNYRNTREIASFSRYFQVRGATSANLPDRTGGQTPLVFLHTEVDQIYDQVTRYAKSHSGREIGVVVFGTKRDVTRAFNKLKARTDKQSVNCTLQGYVNAEKGKGITEVSKLVFDDPPVITVLHAQSAKGLEFDTVFIINLNAAGARDALESDTYKKLYVVSSRARDAVFLSLRASLHENFYPDVLRLFPPPADKLCNYFDSDGELVCSDALGSAVEWKLSAYESERRALLDCEDFDFIRRADRADVARVLETLAIKSFYQEASATVIEEKIVHDEGLVDVLIELGRVSTVPAILEAIR